jgi:hypothetical protein
MKFTHTSTLGVRIASIGCALAIGLLLAFPVNSAEERPGRPAPIPPEQLEKVWAAEAKCAAATAEVPKEKAEGVVKAYVKARKDYAEKIAALPRTRESFQQRRELAEKAQGELKEALVKAAGAEKAEKMVGMLAQTGMGRSRVDRMVNGLLGFKLAEDKLKKAMVVVMEYNGALGKAMAEARESGSFEGVREKMQALTDGLNKKMAGILTEEQLATWKETYGRTFRGRGGRRPE